MGGLFRNPPTSVLEALMRDSMSQRRTKNALADALTGRTEKPPTPHYALVEALMQRKEPEVPPPSALGNTFREAPKGLPARTNLEKSFIGSWMPGAPSLPPSRNSLTPRNVPTALEQWARGDDSVFRSPIKTRHVFFSFHYADVMRVNSVRGNLAFRHLKEDGISRTFYDRSLWESSKRTNPESLKSLIRNGVKHSSVVCVLIGSETWSRQWVKYEIARAIVERKGLLAVDINLIKHHRDGCPHQQGSNPLEWMAVGQTKDGTFRLFELGPFGWQLYADYTLAVPLPEFLPVPPVDMVMPLSEGTDRYDFVLDNGAHNLGDWTLHAAERAGR